MTPKKPRKKPGPKFKGATAVKLGQLSVSAEVAALCHRVGNGRPLAGARILLEAAAKTNES
jgi:hypothetical protein